MGLVEFSDPAYTLIRSALTPDLNTISSAIDSVGAIRDGTWTSGGLKLGLTLTLTPTLTLVLRP